MVLGIPGIVLSTLFFVSGEHVAEANARHLTSRFFSDGWEKNHHLDMGVEPKIGEKTQKLMI